MSALRRAIHDAEEAGVPVALMAKMCARSTTAGPHAKAASALDGAAEAQAVRIASAEPYRRMVAAEALRPPTFWTTFAAPLSRR